MDWLIDNWYLVVGGIAIVASIVLLVVHFFKLPTEEQLKKVREWLLLAVTTAEKELGSGTGKLKLRYVYDKFVERFNWIARVLSFDKFSELVDDALEEMKHLLESSKPVQQYVGVTIEPNIEEVKEKAIEA